MATNNKTQVNHHTTVADQVWQQIRTLGAKVCTAEPELSNFINRCILNQQRFENSISCMLSGEFLKDIITRQNLYDCFLEVLTKNPDILDAIAKDLNSYYAKDPACDSILTAFLYFKGFHSLTIYRINNALWHSNRKAIANNLHYQCTRLFDVDIHPAATLGKGLMIDHATGVVIGETAILEDNISILHGVTLGGGSNTKGKRHPTIRSGVLLSTGAKVIGDIEVGKNAKIAASSLVQSDVPAGATVAGVPAKIVRMSADDIPAENMEHKL